MSVLSCCYKAVYKSTDVVVDNVSNRGRGQSENHGDLHGEIVNGQR